MKKLLMAATALAAFAASPSYAVTSPVTGTPFFVPPGGGGAFSEFFFSTPSATTFTSYFTFSLTAIGGATTSSGLQSIELQGDGVDFSAVGLYSGAVVGSGSLVTGGAFSINNTGPQSMAALTDLPITTGSYYIQVQGSVPTGNSGYTGSVLFAPAAVPEPATWGLMILGFGLVGAAMRNRRRAAVAA